MLPHSLLNSANKFISLLLNADSVSLSCSLWLRELRTSTL